MFLHSFLSPRFVIRTSYRFHSDVRTRTPNNSPRNFGSDGHSSRLLFIKHPLYAAHPSPAAHRGSPSRIYLNDSYHHCSAPRARRNANGYGGLYFCFLPAGHKNYYNFPKFRNKFSSSSVWNIFRSRTSPRNTRTWFDRRRKCPLIENASSTCFGSGILRTTRYSVLKTGSNCCATGRTRTRGRRLIFSADTTVVTRRRVS